MPIHSSNRLSAIYNYPLLNYTDCPQPTYTHKYVRVRDPEQLVGIEIEVEGIKNPLESFYNFQDNGLCAGLLWEVTNDNSLKNYGKEFVSRPLAGDHIYGALEILNSYLKNHQPEHEFMYRCGTHFHFDCRYMTIEHLFKFLICYILVEDVFYDLVGEERKASNFCVPLSYSKFNLGIPEVFQLYFRGEYEQAIRSLLNYWKKYTGLNLLPLKTQGTIEFRHYAGTCDPEYLTEQIRIIQNMINYSEQTSMEELDKISRSLNVTSGYNYFCNQVLGVDYLASGETLQRLMEGNVKTVRDIFSFISYCKKNSDNFPGSRLHTVLELPVQSYTELRKKHQKQIDLWDRAEHSDTIGLHITKKLAGPKALVGRLMKKKPSPDKIIVEFK